MANTTLTGSYSGSNANNYGIRCVCSSKSNGSVANTSDVTVTLQMRRAVNTGFEGQWNIDGSATGRIIINGVDSGTSSVTFDTRNTTDWITLKTFTVKNIAHNGDGSKSITIKAYFEPNATSSLYGGTVSGTFKLDTIPRYATSNQSLKSKTETSITMNWSSDSVVDYVWYSTDWGTTWKAIGSVNAKSGSYTIKTQSRDTSSLSPNTTYNVVTRVRRKDSQLTTNSSVLSVATYDYPNCNKMGDFTIGNKLTLSFYNPLSRTFKLEVIGADGTVQLVGDYSGTKVEGFNNDFWQNFWYSTIPNAKSGTYKVKVTYGSSVSTKTGGVYSVKGTETPTIGTITYADTNTTVTAITGNNQHIVQNQSNLKVTFTTATAKNGATIKKHTFVLNGVTKESTAQSGTVDFGKVNSANDLTLTVTVTDSRGLTTKLTKTVTMLAHSKPTAKVNLERLNNYEDDTYLTVDASISSVNGKNTVAIKYRYKVSGGSYNSYSTTADKETKTLQLDKNNSYIVEVVVTDAFGSSFSGEYAVAKGVFPFFIDTVLNSVGINCFPTKENSLEIKGSFYLNGDIMPIIIAKGTDLNTLLLPNTYRSSSGAGDGTTAYYGNCPIVANQSFVIEVIPHGSNAVLQRLSICSKDYGGTYERHYYSGSWGAWLCTCRRTASNSGCYYMDRDGVNEWITPPMVLGTEYRTVERYQGKVVYTKLIDGGAMPNSSAKTVSIGASASNIISIDATIENGTYIGTFPFFDSNGKALAVFYVKNSSGTFSTFSDMSSYNAKILVKYTK